MAYSPLGQGRILRQPALLDVAHRHRATPAQIALAWVPRVEDIVAIPGAGTPEHVRDNAAARELRLTFTDFVILDAAFPPPQRRAPLEVL
jgi:diketogulonate reductase-like aldo/keto reductase